MLLNLILNPMKKDTLLTSIALIVAIGALIFNGLVIHKAWKDFKIPETQVIQLPGQIQTIEKPVARAEFITATAKFYMFNLGAGDTMDIDKGDKIVAIHVSVPSSATDTVQVIGDTITIDGFTTDTLRVSPGEHLSLEPPSSEGRLRINKLSIIVADTARVIMMPVKE